MNQSTVKRSGVNNVDPDGDIFVRQQCVTAANDRQPLRIAGARIDASKSEENVIEARQALTVLLRQITLSWNMVCYCRPFAARIAFRSFNHIAVLYAHNSQSDSAAQLG